MRRYTETFFRYWLIALAPIVILSGIGYVSVRSTPKTAQATAKLWVAPSVDNSNINNQFETPAQNEQDALTQLKQLSSFDWAVAHGSPLYMKMLSQKPNPGDYLGTDLQTNVQFTTGGTNLLYVSYTYSSRNWQLGLELVQSLVNTALNQTELLNRQQAASSISYYQYQLQGAQQQLGQASQALSAYMAAHNLSAADVTTQMAVDSRMASLYQQVQTNQQSVLQIRQKLGTLKIQSTASSAVGQSGLHVADSATAIIVSSKKKEIMSLAIYLVIGLLLSAGFVVGKTLMDRSLRYADEVPDVLDLPVLAVVPYDRTLAARSGKATRLVNRPGSGKKGPSDLSQTG